VLGSFPRCRRPFSAQDERLLTLFANQAALALENARLFAKPNSGCSAWALCERRRDQLGLIARG
jgi:GAF domain-containing protein